MKVTFHIGDRVKIVDPRFFVRCGYPLDKGLEQDRIWKAHSGVINQFLHTVVDPKFEGCHWYQRAAQDLAAALAFAYIHSKAMGGRERTLHLTPPVEVYRGVVCEIHNKRVVRTGKYIPACYEEEPAYLDCSSTHVILHLNRFDRLEGMRANGRLMIPAAHVEKVEC